jgi:hypothetical protein
MQAQSREVFSVNRHQPQASIQTPQNNTLYVSDQTLILAGTGYDIEDGQLSNSGLSWSSSLDGSLGSGNSLSINVSALSEGTHVITLSARDSDGQIGAASVTIQVVRTRPVLPTSLSVGPNSFDFAIGAGIVQTAPQVLAVRNNGDGFLNWSASADQNWIRLSSTVGSAPANISITADPSGLTAGQYIGHVTIESIGVLGSPKTIDVTLNVLSPELMLNESGSALLELAALDSVLRLRDPFPIVNDSNRLNQSTDRNTRVTLFVTNIQLAPSESASSVVLNLIDSNKQSYDIAAEDVRQVPNFNFTQVTFRLPDNIAVGSSTIKVKVHGLVSNLGTIRIRN